MAVSNLSMPGWSYNLSVTAGSTMEIPMAMSGRIILSSHNSSTGLRGLYIMIGTSIVYPIVESSVLSLSYADGKLKIKNNASAGTAQVLIY